MPQTLGAMHLSATKKYEIQRTNNFEVQIDGLGSDITLLVQSCPLPTISNEAIEVNYGNSKVKVAGKANFDDIEISVLDAIGVDTEMKLWEWRKKVYDPETDKIGFAQDYKKSGRIYQYAPDGTYLRTWKIIGAFPTTMNLGELSYENSDKKTISMTISIDKAIPVRE